MTDSPLQETDLVDSLNHKVLLDLASDDKAAAKASHPYTLPTADELEELFPELQIVEMVGSGGMGCVFRASQTKLARDVALKILPRELARDDLFTERFGREARAMARLNHPNIVSIHDFGQSGGLHFLIMEYMDGMNLRELLDSGNLQPVEALRVFEQVCQALAYAHAEGVIHRDIKPENILFSKVGHVALADFGLARLATDSHAAVSLTQTRQAMGTLNYMAPEQWEDPKSVDHRVDIYALGILLYEMLSGRVPRGSFPPVSSVCDVPSSVDDAINRALQVNASDRFSTVAGFHQAACVGITDSATAAFDENGTFTNFVNLGANMFRVLPTPQNLLGADWAGRHAIWTSLTTTLLVTVLTLLPWMYIERTPFMGMEVSVEADRTVQVPVALLPVAMCIVFVLSLLRRRIQPLRADLLSLLLCVLCIVLVALAFSGLRPVDDPNGTLWRQFTVAPYLALLILILQTIETLVRIGWQLWTPMAQAYERSQLEQRRKKAESRDRWKARWTTFCKGFHELVGTDKRRKRD